MEIGCLYILAKYKDPIPCYRLKIGDVVTENILDNKPGIKPRRRVIITDIIKTNLKGKICFVDQDHRFLKGWYDLTLTMRHESE